MRSALRFLAKVSGFFRDPNGWNAVIAMLDEGSKMAISTIPKSERPVFQWKRGFSMGTAIYTVSVKNQNIVTFS
jgi:hypothetical protein